MAEATKDKPKQRTKAQTAIDEFDGHLRGCPVASGDSDRENPIETFVATAPALRDSAGGISVPDRKVRITRCVECAGQVRHDPKGDAYRAELAGNDTEEV